jgi:conjugative relaxase-like TrwC/TraI family protein
MSDSGEGAARYFDKALATGDYYTKDVGRWGGKGAERLGLGELVTREQFVALGSNKVPGTGETLTVRNKDKRTPGYDFCFSVPKSVSLYLGEVGDEAVERMIKEAFKETMVDIERRMETRVRVAGQDADRISGNMVYAWFVHRETRPINGLTDPHFHIHAYVFNATFDDSEKRCKAGQFMNLKADAPFYEAAFNARLADKLIKDGYGIRRTERDFELASVSRGLIDKFSKRTVQIEELFRRQYTVLSAQARALVKATGMEFADALAMMKSKLGAKSRKAKSEIKLSAEEQLANWRSQMTPEERTSLMVEIVKGTRSENLLEPMLAKALAVTHLFERSSIARELHAAGMLLRRGIGRVSVDQARVFAAQDPRFVRPHPAARVLTTREVLHEESETLRIVEAGKGKYDTLSFGCSWDVSSPLVAGNKEAVEAIHHVLNSQDIVIEVRGVAGAGKTTMLQEVVKAVASLSGKDVMVFAPSSSAVQELKRKGFKASDTVQGLMRNQFLQDIAKGKVLMVDEAGFLSAKQMRWMVEFASKNVCRLILSGDTRQHHGVERGDSVRVLEDLGVLRPAVLTKIFRQKVAALREAIGELANGKTLEGFDKLDQYGAIIEIEDQAERLGAICQKYLEATKKEKTALIVAPTHAECRETATAVREKLKAEGIISAAEQTVTRLERLNLTAAQRADAVNYEPGNVIEFHARAGGGFKSGEQWQVVGRSKDSELVLEKNGQQRGFCLSQPGRFSVFEVKSIPLAVGDRVRITKNFTSQGKRLCNNTLHMVTAIEDGKIKLDEAEIALGAKGLHIDQGFVVTSHASQSQTVQELIASVPVESFSQVNQAQFYVSMSRGSETLHLFTDSKVALREAVTKPSTRLSALEVMHSEEIGLLQSASKYLRNFRNGQQKRQNINHEQERGIER